MPFSGLIRFAAGPKCFIFSRLVQIVIHETLEILSVALSQILSHSLVRPLVRLGSLVRPLACRILSLP